MEHHVHPGDVEAAGSHVRRHNHLEQAKKKIEQQGVYRNTAQLTNGNTFKGGKYKTRHVRLIIQPRKQPPQAELNHKIEQHHFKSRHTITSVTRRRILLL